MCIRLESKKTSLLLVLLAGGCASAPTPRYDAQPVYAPASTPASAATVEPASTSTSAAVVEPVPLPYESSAARGPDKWEFTIGGSGASDQDVSHGSASISASLGYMLGDHFELVGRQDLLFDDTTAAGSITHASSRLAADLVLGSGVFQPFIGANVGYVYGDLTRDTWEAAPEGGVKLFLREHVFLQLMAEYQFFFQTSDEADEAFNDGSLVYSIGLGMTF